MYEAVFHAAAPSDASWASDDFVVELKMAELKMTPRGADGSPASSAVMGIALFGREIICVVFFAIFYTYAVMGLVLWGALLMQLRVIPAVGPGLYRRSERMVYAGSGRVARGCYGEWLLRRVFQPWHGVHADGR